MSRKHPYIPIAGCVGLWLCVACGRADVPPAQGEPSALPVPVPVPVTAAPAVPEPTAPTPAVAPAVMQQVARKSLAWLEAQVRAAAGDPENPWALAHGLLAFGKAFKTRDGRSAVEVVAAFAQRMPSAPADKPRYGFPETKNGKPVEPHPYLLVKTFLEIGVARKEKLRAADGTAIDVQRLLSDMRAAVQEPTDDARWHESAWWLTALELDRETPTPAHARLREAAVARLEADNAVIPAAPSEDAFASSAPMGAAKRNKTHIYGHACGGMHFTQAALRAAAGSGAPELVTRVGKQLERLLVRYRAERLLYAQTLRSHPSAGLLVTGQQLKFFGHLLEVLALADELGLLRNNTALAHSVRDAQIEATGDLLGAIAYLEKERAYARLQELAVKQPQLVLDLIGDGCHAIHGLRDTLVTLRNDDVAPAP